MEGIKAQNALCNSVSNFSNNVSDVTNVVSNVTYAFSDLCNIFVFYLLYNYKTTLVILLMEIIQKHSPTILLGYPLV